jgi:hypothetical protein
VRWYAMSTGFLTDPKIEKLGEKHGPAGPLVIVSLFGNAALQEAGGTVERTFRATAHDAFIEREDVARILDDAIQLGLCHEVSRDVTGFVVTFPAWKRHQATGRKAKERAAKKTGEKPHDQANVTDRHNESHDVPHSTRQDKTEDSSSAHAREGGKHEEILRELDKVAFARSLSSPKVKAAAKACADFSHLGDLTAEVSKFVHYWTEGPGASHPLSDVAWAWRNWLERVKDEPGGRQRKPSNSATDLSAYAGIEAAT